MRKLIKGLRQFKTDYFCTHLELFEQLAHKQKPRVLFITCSDSRIVPSLLMQTDPGELFVIRNAGNIIPPFGAANGGEGATVEYAIHALGIEQIVVCGHSHCGAMKGLLQLGKLEEEMPLVYDWLKHAEATRRLVRENYSGHDTEELLDITIAENVLTQIENLKTYPVVRSKLYQGKLKLYGWIYQIESGEVLAYDAETHSYLPPPNQSLGSAIGEEKGTLEQFAPLLDEPIACEVPMRFSKTETTTPPNQTTNGNGLARSGSAAHTQRSSQNSASREDITPLWLSPEQANRVYRGSHSR